jgi:molybdopterin-containing oxidoreductase family iron-sulfur binding subunit
MKPFTENSPAWQAARAKLQGARGRTYWRSLEELAETENFQTLLRREFPESMWQTGDGLGRREFLKLMGASLALAGITTSCTRQPLQEIVPYIRQPEELTPGRPLFYATAMPFRGFAQGLVVTSWEGHPTKIEGNELHPISLGATNAWMQAALLDLYDPDRAQAVTRAGEVSSWPQFLSALGEVLETQKARRGSGLRILAEPDASPTRQAQKEALLARFPEARWHEDEAISRANAREGARLALGRELETHYAFDKARVVVALDADFLMTHPASLRYVRQFTDGRRVAAGVKEMNRLYVAEPTLSVTGGMAEHHAAVKGSEVEELARALARQLEGKDAEAGHAQMAWVAAAAGDLQANRGASLVLAGDDQAPLVHALAHAMNETLGNLGQTVWLTEPLVKPSESLASLAGDLAAGKVEALIILGGNPVFTAPADWDLGKLLGKVEFSAHLSGQANETAELCSWHIPEAHFLEAWSDGRAFDGTVSIQQPLVNPLYNGISAHELLAAMLRTTGGTSYDIVRGHWAGDEASWRKAVHDGVVEGTEAPSVAVTVNRTALERGAPGPARPGLEVVFKPDPTLWDGRYANNGWLQELSKPITKVTWENPALISPALAAERKLENGDVVEVSVNGRTLRLPVWIAPGQADDCVTLYLGNGRHRVGHVGSGIGANAYALRDSRNFYFGAGEMRKTGEKKLVASTQLFHNIESEERQILREGAWAEFQKNPGLTRASVEEPPQEETLYNVGEFNYAGPRWAMSIDLTTCVGCNACVAACQAENNIPVVGKEQVAKGRSMQWIRIDSYFRGPPANPAVAHMPVPCMHCEDAPCELVCPVAATVHDHEGLNLQVYNRCVGTRFCSNNCPYKVRRFNFLFYAKPEYETPSLKAMLNPEVTVRWRGVMEKCTYCIQRISSARIAAQKEDRRIRDGEVTPACAQACPARAIVFGDISDPNSRISQRRRHPLNYGMLAQLNTRPRTTYLAKLSNPHA